MERRSFLKAAAIPAIVPSTVFGKRAPSNKVHLAAFGVGGRGSHVTMRMREHPDAQFLAVCDCYEARREKRREEWNAAYGGDYVKAYSNPQDVLARDDIDAVVIATPDHWHGLIGLAAARAGKHIYGEKPLTNSIGEGRATRSDVARVAAKLADFYKTCQPVPIAPCDYRERLQADVGANLRELVLPDYRLPAATAQRAAAAQLELLGCAPELFAERVGAGRIVEAHGDLRAEHVCLGAAPVIIDCLEFNRDFRTLDPADELAFLALDCERLGAPWIRDLLFDVYRRTTGDRPPEQLVHFYTSHRACLRAKIAIWHLREPEVQQPENWRELARTYLGLADGYARQLR